MFRILAKLKREFFDLLEYLKDADVMELVDMTDLKSVEQ